MIGGRAMRDWVFLGALGVSLLGTVEAGAQPRGPGGETLGHDPTADEGEGDGPDVRVCAAPPVVAVPLMEGTRPVASGRGVTLRAEEVLRRVQEAPQPLLQRFAADPALLQQLVDTLVAERLLAAEARRLGLESDPIVQAATDRALVARLRALHLTARGGTPAEVPEVEVRQWYDQHPDRFHIPERRRVRVIFSPDRREANETLRLALLQRRRARAGGEFRRMAGVRNADPVLRALFGEIRAVTREPVPGAPVDPEIPPLDPALRIAAFEVVREGEVLPRLVMGRWGNQEGYFVLRLVDRRPAIERTYADSAEWIRHRIVLERRVAAEQTEVERLRRSLRVTGVTAREIVRIEPAGPTVAQSSPSSSISAQQGLGTGRPR